MSGGGRGKRRRLEYGRDHEISHSYRNGYRKKVGKEQTRPFKKRWPESNIFPFLELPGEIRNRIYDLIIHTTRREFPTSSFSKEHQPARRTRHSPRLDYKPPIPYLNLIHSCRQLRTELRPLWLQTHQITLGNTPKYIRTFFPARSKKDVKYYNVSGYLRVYVRYDEVEGRDMLPLIKQSFNFPNRKIEFTHGPSVQKVWAEGRTKLIRNRNPEWSRLIRGDMISQVRIDKVRGNIVIVVKHRYLEPWMKEGKILHAPYPDRDKMRKLRIRLGLERVDCMTFRLSAVYS